MNKYELTVLLKTELKGEAKEAYMKKIEKVVAAFKGKVGKTSELGQKQLAYPIQKLTEAQYVQWIVELPGSAVVEFDKKLSTERDIMRYLLVKAE